MIVLGYGGCGCANSSIAAPLISGRYEYAKVSNSLADNLHFCNGTDTWPDDGESKWTSNTIITAKFDKNMIGGDNNYILEQVSALRVKRRKVGDYNWITIYEHPVKTLDDFLFQFYDVTANGNNTEYEYGVTVVANNSEQGIITVKCISDFVGAIITDGTTSYGVILEPSVTSTDRVRPSSVVTTLSGKYPFVFYGGDTQYESGSFSGIGIEYNSADKEFDVDGGTEYRKSLIDWLLNGDAKILKMYDGRSWMISIDGNVTTGYSDHYQKVSVSFNFTEIGSMESTTDLYNNGFINCNIEGT